ncbi:methyltransferase domain-containing protein [Candidatus Woesebacteria bacterium]|nr:methyltransferase domain-containing protein [Candidatus Woesebacteria bacterium]
MINKHYDKKYFIKRDILDERIAKTLLIFAKENNINNVLEVGCGTGRLVKYLNDHKLNTKGCDISPEGLKIANKINKNINIIKASATFLPFKRASFDMVISISTIEHLTKRESVRFILQAKKVLKPNGFIFLITPNFNSPMRYLLGKRWFGYSDPTHITFFIPNSLRKLLNSCGFDNIKFRFKSAYNLKFDYHIPGFLRRSPNPIKNLLNYLMISSYLSTFRDSFWISGQNTVYKQKH